MLRWRGGKPLTHQRIGSISPVVLRPSASEELIPATARGTATGLVALADVRATGNAGAVT